jgi:hypothetical protein
MTIETKFAPEDEVWMMENNRPKEYTISEVAITSKLDGMYQVSSAPSVRYLLKYTEHPYYSEECLYPTKAELLASL